MWKLTLLSKRLHVQFQFTGASKQPRYRRLCWFFCCIVGQRDRRWCPAVLLQHDFNFCMGAGFLRQWLLFGVFLHQCLLLMAEPDRCTHGHKYQFFRQLLWLQCGTHQQWPVPRSRSAGLLPVVRKIHLMFI